MEIYDVVVVGGGPIGSRVAYLTAKKGLKTLLVEEHKTFGKPLHCAGKIYAKAFEEFNLPKEAIINEVKGAYFYSPDGYMFKVSRSEVDSYIVDREVLDLKLAERAYDAGAILKLNTKCYNFEKKNQDYVVKLKQEGLKFEVKTRVLVDAEGWNSLIARRIGLHKGLGYLKGIQYEMVNVDFNHENFVELYFGNKFFPGFFGWIIPLEDRKARVGLCVNKDLTSKPPTYYLKKTLKFNPKISKKIGKGKIIRVFGGIIPIHGPLKKIVWDKIVLVGDSAGQVKSTTGGGLYFGLNAAGLAGKIISKFLETGEPKILEFYGKMFWEKFGKELKFTSLLRRILDKFSDDELNYIFKVIGENRKFLAKVEEECSSQTQFKVFRLMIKNPKLLLKLVKFTPKFFLW